MTPTPADPQHILVIGAGPGIGSAVATRFAREGFTVTLVARREDALNELAESLRQTGASVNTLSADASDPAAFRTALESVSPQPGVVVYNAALLRPDSLLTTDAEELITANNVNVIGAIVAAQVFAPAQEAAGQGTILLTGGGLALNPNAAFGSLALGKAGIRSTATLLAQELAPKGIHVASITVSASVKPGTDADPALIAELYWDLHQQNPQDWQSEAAFPRG